MNDKQFHQPQPEPNEQMPNLQTLFLMHANGLKTRYLPCEQCEGETLHLIKTVGMRRLRQCDICGRETWENA